MSDETSHICFLIKKSPTAAEKWEIIGRKLGLSSENLVSIGQKRKKSEQRLFATISAWLNRKHLPGSGIRSNVTLRTLVTILRLEEVGETNLAKIIQMEGMFDSFGEFCRGQG